MPAVQRVQRAHLEVRGNIRQFFGMTKGYREIMLDGPAGCLAGESKLLDTQRGYTAIEELFNLQISPVVLTQHGEVRAEAPFLKGKARLFRVTTESGKQCVVTEDHLFFTQNGWMFTGFLSSDEHLLVCGDGLLESSWESSLKELRQDAPHLMKTVPDYLESCRCVRHSYDEQPLSRSGLYQESVPSQGDVLLHTRAGSRLGDRADAKARIQTCQEHGHLSTLDYLVLPDETFVEISRGYANADEDFLNLYQSDERFQSLTCPSPASSQLCPDCGSRLQFAHSFFEHQPCVHNEEFAASRLASLPQCLLLVPPTNRALRLISFGDQLSAGCPFGLPPKYKYTDQWDKVVSVEYVRTDFYFDLHVPLARHYISDGIYSHNTGKTRGILERQHLICAKRPMVRGLIVRKFRSSMNETVLECLDNRVYRDPDGQPYSDSPRWYERDQKYVYTHNDSEIIIAGMDDPTKVMSSQYDWFYWNEAIEGTRGEWEAIMSRLRNGRLPYQQAIGDTNPGPPTHWINTMALEGKLVRLPTVHKDNPAFWEATCQCTDHQHTCVGEWTPAGDQYVNGILRDSLTGLRRKRLYDGLWVAAEGQVYPEWDASIHVVQRRTLPKHWLRYWVFDFGFVDPFVWQEWVECPDTGQLILYRELYHTGMRVEEAAKLIKSVSFGVIPFALICDHDAENRATLEKELGYFTVPAYKSIAPGIQAVQLRMKSSQRWSSYNESRPGLVIMENANIKTDSELVFRHKPTCTKEEIEGYVWDTKKMDQDKHKDMPVGKDDHGMDTMKYAVAFVDNIAIDPQDAEESVAYNDFDDSDELEQHYRMTQLSRF